MSDSGESSIPAGRIGENTQVSIVFRSALLVCGVLSGSTAVIMIKASTVHPVALAAFRQLIAAFALTPFLLIDIRKHGITDCWRIARKAIVPGILLGLHFISWNVGARMTYAANASLIVNMVPLVMPVLLFVTLRESLTGKEAVGTILAISGVAVLGAGDFHFSRESFWGDITCFGSMLLFAMYLVSARGNLRPGRLWSYMVPLYTAGGTFCLLMSLVFTEPFRAYSTRDLGFIVGLGLIPTVLGHSILNFSMRVLRGQVVSIVNLGQFLFAGILAFVFLGEIPEWPFWVAAVLVASGASIALGSEALKNEGSE